MNIFSFLLSTGVCYSFYQKKLDQKAEAFAFHSKFLKDKRLRNVSVNTLQIPRIWGIELSVDLVLSSPSGLCYESSVSSYDVSSYGNKGGEPK